MNRIIALFLIICASVNGQLSDSCVRRLLALSGPEFSEVQVIPQKLVADEVLKSGQSVTFYHHYKCSNCDKDNSMRPNTSEDRTVCEGCGKPHDGEQTYELKVNGVPVIPVNDLVEGNKKSVKDLRWKCRYCDSVNTSSVSLCPGCGSTDQSANKVRIGYDGVKDLESARNYSPDSETRRNSEGEQHTQGTQRERKSGNFWSDNWKWVAGSAASVAAGAGALAWGLQKDEFLGDVTSMAWSHEIDIQEFQPVHYYDWCDKLVEIPPVMPKNGSGERGGVSDIRSQGLRPRREFSHLEYYQEDVPYQDIEYYTDTRTVNNGNGTSTIESYQASRTVTKYRRETKSREVYENRLRPWCEYTVYEWKLKRTERTTGGEPTPGELLPIPQVNLNKYEKQLPIRKNYQISIDYSRKGKTETYVNEVGSEDEFRSWSVGAKALIYRRKIGTISEVKRITPESQ